MSRRAALVCLRYDPDCRAPDGGTLRTNALHSALTNLGWQVDVVAVDAEAASVGGRRSRGRLGALKRSLLPAPTLLGARSPVAVELVRRLGRIDLVVSSGWNVLPVARAARAPLWLDLHDLYSRLARAEAGHRRGPASLTSRLQAKVLEAQEHRYVSSASIVTAAGWGDALAVSAVRPDVSWLPNPVSTAAPVRRPAGGRTLRVGMIGSFEHWPNRYAVHHTLRTWLPDPASVGVEILLAGRGSQDLQLWPGCRALGSVDDPDVLYRQIDVALVPVDRGGGVKVKLLEALGRGVPVITTRHGAEGLCPPLASAVTVVPSDRALTTTQLVGTTPVDMSLVHDHLSSEAFVRTVTSALAEL